MPLVAVGTVGGLASLPAVTSHLSYRQFSSCPPDCPPWQPRAGVVLGEGRPESSGTFSYNQPVSGVLSYPHMPSGRSSVEAELREGVSRKRRRSPPSPSLSQRQPGCFCLTCRTVALGTTSRISEPPSASSRVTSSSMGLGSRNWKGGLCPHTRPWRFT